MAEAKADQVFPPPGYSHSSPSPVFSIGSTVSEGVREFAETGATDLMDMEAVNKTFLDTIISHPIEQGVGQTNTNIFLDSNNTKVSRKIFIPCCVECLDMCFSGTNPPKSPKICNLSYISNQGGKLPIHVGQVVSSLSG
jgi:hypothetical protein